MTDECWICGITEDLENWGKYLLCKKCAEHCAKKWSKIPKAQGNNLRIKPHSNVGASYDPDDGAIELCSPTENMSELCVWIQHEATHLVLHRMFGIQCCFQWDNISPGSKLEWWCRDSEFKLKCEEK